MDRRQFGKLTGVSALAMAAGVEQSKAQADVTALTFGGSFPPLGPGLTAHGAEAAGNAAGTIPPYTGGMTAPPPGIPWDSTKTLPPDFFASDAMLYEVNQSNLSQYAHLVSDGLQSLIAKGFSMPVYPSHRTVCYPDILLKAMANNVGKATLLNNGRDGFSGVLGSIPFPLINTSDDALTIGGQLIWNHLLRWTGIWLNNWTSSFVIQGGNAPVLSAYGFSTFYYSYFDPNMTFEQFDGTTYKLFNRSVEPATITGNAIVYWDTVDPAKIPIKVWTLLAGQGRVRRSPEVEYDTPSSFLDGVSNYDESFGFSGAPNQNDWTYIATQEMLIPYNNNKIYTYTAEDFHGPKFPNPQAIRWELHRVWVLECTLHPGFRNVMAKRRMYIDEDTWQIHIADTWDAGGNLYRCNLQVFTNMPGMLGTVWMNAYPINLQTGDWDSNQGGYANPPHNKPWTLTPSSISIFDPQNMAASAAY
jgi:hypothetical protein